MAVHVIPVRLGQWFARRATSARTKARRRRVLSRTQKGFSLFELLLVMIIVGAIASIAATRWSGWTGDLDAAAETLAADLRYAQARALHQAADHGIAFTAAKRYELRQCNDEPCDDFTRVAFADGSMNRELPQEVQREGPPGDEVRFRYPFGGLEGGQDAVIRLARDGDERVIRVLMTTGYVERQP